MSGVDPEDATVVVVDDEPEVADAYALRLHGRYDDVRTAYGGEEALEAVDGDVDVVLLDRRMPYSGDKVLEAIRDRGLPCRVVMVTAVDPGFDIVDMPFDDYLCKPIEREDLLSAVDQQLQSISREERMRSFFSAVAKLGVLESEMAPEQLEGTEEYEELERRAEELRAALDVPPGTVEEMLEEFTAIDRSSG